METFVKVLVGSMGIIALMLVVGLLFSYPVMLLWNGCLVPAVTGVHSITWIQAYGILILTSFLFKSSGSSSSSK